MILQHLLLLQSDGIYVLDDPEKLVLEELGAFLVSLHHIEGLLYILRMLLHYFLIKLLQVVTESELVVGLPDPHFEVLDCLVLQQSIQESSLLLLLLLTVLILGQLQDLLAPLRDLFRS